MLKYIGEIWIDEYADLRQVCVDADDVFHAGDQIGEMVEEGETIVGIRAATAQDGNWWARHEGKNEE